MKNTKVLVPIILVLVGLGAGFFGGIQYRNYQLNKARAGFAAGGSASAAGAFQRFNGRTGGTGTGAARGGAVTGSILSVDGNSFTVKLADGSSKIVLFSASTTYSNTVSGAQSDLKVGGNVMVMGSTNSDGSVTATNVQINPMSFRPQGSPVPTATP
jgi:predicted small secreted protein